MLDIKWRRGATAVLLLLLILAAPAFADETPTLLARAWPYAPFASLAELGHGIAVVFSPDLSVKGNCRFYAALGFACFDDPSWARVVDGIREFNARNPHRPIRTIVLETHGTNGNGLKLQTGKQRRASRSYISVGGLQERVEEAGVRYILITSCNSGRLLRPTIYRQLNPKNGDKAFLPATLGIFGASPDWDPAQSEVAILTPARSRVEMTVVGSVGEMPPAVLRAITLAAIEAGVEPPDEFAISDLLMQIITADEKLRLQVASSVEKFSKERTTAATSERLFARFIDELERRVRRQETPRYAGK